jgi:hypothetical protein
MYNNLFIEWMRIFWSNASLKLGKIYYRYSLIINEYFSTKINFSIGTYLALYVKLK